MGKSFRLNSKGVKDSYTFNIGEDAELPGDRGQQFHVAKSYWSHYSDEQLEGLKGSTIYKFILEICRLGEMDVTDDPSTSTESKPSIAVSMEGKKQKSLTK